MKTITDVLKQVTIIQRFVLQFDAHIKVNLMTGEYSVPYYVQYYNDDYNDIFKCASLGEQLAISIRDADAPMSESAGRELCQFLELSKEETRTVLSVCCTDSSVERYHNEQLIESGS